jgi:MFS family permease
MNSRNLRINTFAYFYSSIGIPAIIVVSVYHLWINHQMTFSQILLLQGLFSLFIIIFEYPSGILADYLNRKYLMALCFVSMAIGSLLYMNATSFQQFVIAELFFGFTFASKSGTDTAFIYDTLLEEGQEENAKNILSKGITIMMFSAGICMILGSILASINLFFAFYTIAGFSLIGAVVYLLTHEPVRIKQTSMKLVVSNSVILLKNRVFILVVILFCIHAIVLRIAFWAYIPKMEVINISIFFQGFVLAGANFIAAGIAYWYGKSSKSENSIIQIIFVSAFFGVLLFTLTVTHLTLFIGIALQQVARGLINPIISVILNKEVTSDIRASALSLKGFIVHTNYLLISLMLDLLKISLTHVMMINVILLIILFSLHLLVSKHQSTQKFDFLDEKYHHNYSKNV